MTATLERTDTLTSIFDDADVFTQYRIALTFTDKVMGGVPQKPEIIESWLRTRILGGDEELRLNLIKTLEDLDVDIPVDATRDEIIEAASAMAKTKAGNTFRRDAAGELCLADYQVKAMLKECTNILFAGERWGSTKKGPKNAVSEWLFVAEHRLGLGRTEPDGVHTQVGHITGPQGPRSTLTYYDYCERASVTFTVSSVGDRVTREQWVKVLTLAQKIGLGALRSMGYGQFVIREFEQV